jgi:hypothetical protein
MNQRNSYVWAAVGLAALSVLVGGFTAKPLLAQIRAALVQNRDEPARQPFHLVTQDSQAHWLVPNGKRYVIEQYSMECLVDRANGGALSDVGVQVNNSAISYDFVQDHASAPHSIDFLSFDNSQIIWAASATTRLYADQLTTIVLFGGTNNSASGAQARSCSGSVSGYAIDLP